MTYIDRSMCFIILSALLFLYSKLFLSQNFWKENTFPCIFHKFRYFKHEGQDYINVMENWEYCIVCHRENKEWNNLCRFINNSFAVSLSPQFKLHIVLTSDSSGDQ